MLSDVRMAPIFGEFQSLGRARNTTYRQGDPIDSVTAQGALGPHTRMNVAGHRWSGFGILQFCQHLKPKTRGGDSKPLIPKLVN
jgi:hypothetical protein